MYIAIVTGYILPSILANNSKIATHNRFMHEPKQLGKRLHGNSNLMGVNEMLLKMIALSF